MKRNPKLEMSQDPELLQLNTPKRRPGNEKVLVIKKAPARNGNKTLHNITSRGPQAPSLNIRYFAIVASCVYNGLSLEKSWMAHK